MEENKTGAIGNRSSGGNNFIFPDQRRIKILANDLKPEQRVL